MIPNTTKCAFDVQIARESAAVKMLLDHYYQKVEDGKRRKLSPLALLDFVSPAFESYKIAADALTEKCRKVRMGEIKLISLAA